MPKMKVVQVSAPGAEFEVVEREIPSRQPATSEFACKPAESVIATRLQKKAGGLVLSTLAFPDTRSQVSLMS
jgi:hypothetical protein